MNTARRMTQNTCLISLESSILRKVINKYVMVNKEKNVSKEDGNI